MGTNKIAVIGLGYVGLPVAMAFGEKYRVKGFDISVQRVEELKKGQDHTMEADTEQLQLLTNAFIKNNIYWQKKNVGCSKAQSGQGIL